MQAREAGRLRVGQREHFGTKAGSAHAEQQNVGEAGGLDFVGEGFQFGGVGELIFGDAEPAQPFGLVFVGPERGVAAARGALLFRRRASR